jgi:hypothetical protein
VVATAEASVVVDSTVVVSAADSMAAALGDRVADSVLRRLAARALPLGRGQALAGPSRSGQPLAWQTRPCVRRRFARRPLRVPSLDAQPCGQRR